MLGVCQMPGSGAPQLDEERGLSGRGDTVIQGLEEGLGGGILSALGTQKKKIFKKNCSDKY